MIWTHRYADPRICPPRVFHPDLTEEMLVEAARDAGGEIRIIERPGEARDVELRYAGTEEFRPMGSLGEPS